jgi:hypothetical protein
VELAYVERVRASRWRESGRGGGELGLKMEGGGASTRRGGDAGIEPVTRRWCAQTTMRELLVPMRGLFTHLHLLPLSWERKRVWLSLFSQNSPFHFSALTMPLNWIL